MQWVHSYDKRQMVISNEVVSAETELQFGTPTDMIQQTEYAH